MCHANELNILHLYCYRADLIIPSVLERAAKEVREGKKSIPEAPRDEQIDRMTLKSYIDKNEHVPVWKRGCDRVAETHKVLSDDMESELAKHIQNIADQLHGLSSLKCRELAYELAHRNNITVPDNWSRNARHWLSNVVLCYLIYSSFIL
uniref:Uncharacterized protein n=1 Tax=Hucho hucho TaxID=62062 RepID=A0A4W5N9M9_9TELE